MRSGQRGLEGGEERRLLEVLGRRRIGRPLGGLGRRLGLGLGSRLRGGWFGRARLRRRGLRSGRLGSRRFRRGRGLRGGRLGSRRFRRGRGLRGRGSGRFRGGGRPGRFRRLRGSGARPLGRGGRGLPVRLRRGGGLRPRPGVGRLGRRFTRFRFVCHGPGKLRAARGPVSRNGAAGPPLVAFGSAGRPTGPARAGAGHGRARGPPLAAFGPARRPTDPARARAVRRPGLAARGDRPSQAHSSAPLRHA